MQRTEWLSLLPDTVRRLAAEWSLEIGAPFARDDRSVSWVAPVTHRNGDPAVLKIGWPHMEAEHEADGLRFWSGDPTVRLIESSANDSALLLERCEPGTPLRTLAEPEQDAIVAGLLTRLWRKLPEGHSFRPLRTMTRCWAAETLRAESQWHDAGLVRAGLALFEELSAPARDDVLLATDLHAGNVLAARREPWLVIDPKPFVGDPAYDATQHLLNCKARLRAAPRATVQRFAGLLETNAERARLWLFARCACEPRAHWDEETDALARALA